MHQVSDVKIWNEIPPEIRTTSFKPFKRYLLQNWYKSKNYMDFL